MNATNGRDSVIKTSMGPATASATFSAFCSGHGFRNHLSQNHVQAGNQEEGERDGDAVGRYFSDRPSPIQVWKIRAMAGSPTQPNAKLASVIPNWTAFRTSSRRACNFWTVRAPTRPAASNCCSRVSRTLTRENSAATKNAFAATNNNTASNRSSTEANIAPILAPEAVDLRSESGCYTYRNLRLRTVQLPHQQLQSRRYLTNSVDLLSFFEMPGF